MYLRVETIIELCTGCIWNLVFFCIPSQFVSPYLVLIWDVQVFITSHGGGDCTLELLFCTVIIPRGFFPSIYIHLLLIYYFI